MESFSSLRVFVKTAETLSFVEAGRRLGLSASAIGKAISRLEERLGARLFHRNTHHVQLTAEGALFLDRSRRILAEMELASQELSDARQLVRGPMRISLPAWATGFIPIFHRFMTVHPEVCLEVEFSDRLVDVVEEGYDLAIRTGAIRDSRLTMRTIGRFRHVLVASPSYLSRHGVPQRPEDLLTHSCLHRRHPQTGAIEAWPLATDGMDVDLDLPVKAVIDHVEARIAFATDGAGIACVPSMSVARHIKDSRLISLMEGHVRDAGVLQLLWASPENTSLSVRKLVDFIVQSGEF